MLSNKPWDTAGVAIAGSVNLTVLSGV